jgi:hypothetical protein
LHRKCNPLHRRHNNLGNRAAEELAKVIAGTGAGVTADLIRA